MGLDMKKFSCLLVLAAAMSTSAWAADCTYPRAPGKLPDGKTAQREEMVAAKKVVDKYNVDMNVYLACIKTEHDEALAKIPSASEDDKKSLVSRYTKKNDAAVDEVQDVAGRFNEQLRVFKAQDKK
jgi:opacity protein-like surface antigen